MTTTKWEVLQQRDLIARASRGVSVKAWCEQNNLNYNTARRHIRPNAQNSQSITRKIHRAQNANNTQKKLKPKNNNHKIQPVNKIEVDGLTLDDCAL